MRRIPKIRSGVASGIHPSIVSCNRKPKVNRMMTEFSFPQLIVVPLSCHEVDGVRKEKERLTAAQRGNDQKRNGSSIIDAVSRQPWHGYYPDQPPAQRLNEKRNHTAAVW